jgi:hypothetical protein
MTPQGDRMRTLLTVSRGLLAAAVLLAPVSFVFAQEQAAPPAQGGGRAGGAGAQGGGGGRGGGAAARPPAAPIRRLPDGKPDMSGFYNAAGRGANYGLEKHERWSFMPGGDGIVIAPADGKLPMQEWAKAELKQRQRPEFGYDDPTAQCTQAAGVPRSFYVPSPFQILQPPGTLLVLFERMSWRQIPITNRPHVPDTIRMWHGDSVGRWEGDTIVVETKNLNGKTWLNEAGEILSHAATVVERFIPVNADTIRYQATITDPIVYTGPWTIEVMFNRSEGELLEVACLEDDQDLQHLKDIKDEARAKEAAGKASPAK